MGKDSSCCGCTGCGPDTKEGKEKCSGCGKPVDECTCGQGEK